MGSALNLIIARGFSGTGASDVGNAMRGEEDRQMGRDSEQLRQGAAVFNQNQAARQAQQVTKNQGMLDQTLTETDAIMQEARELDSLAQQNPNDPALQTRMVDLTRRAQAIDARNAAVTRGGSVVDVLMPRQQAQESEPLVRVNTPEGPRFMPRSQAAGMEPYVAPQAQPAPTSHPLVAVQTSEGPRYVPRDEAVNMQPALPPSMAQQITPKDSQTAKTKRLQIAAARSQLRKVQEKFDAARGMSAGPGSGLLPTSAGRAFDAAVNQLRQLQTAVTRVPGVGAMSDYETRLASAALPSRNEYEEVTQQQIDGINDLLNLLDNGYAEMGGGGSGATGYFGEPGAKQPKSFTTSNGTTVTIRD